MRRDTPNSSSLTAQWRALGPLGQGTVTGTAIGALVMLWLTLALVTGPGATWRILLPALLFLLPVLGLGAAIGLAIGWLARMALHTRRA